MILFNLQNGKYSSHLFHSTPGIKIKVKDKSMGPLQCNTKLTMPQNKEESEKRLVRSSEDMLTQLGFHPVSTHPQEGTTFSRIQLEMGPRN